MASQYLAPVDFPPQLFKDLVRVPVPQPHHFYSVHVHSVDQFLFRDFYPGCAYHSCGDRNIIC